MNKKINIITLFILSCPFVFRAYPVDAAEISVTGNGQASINEAVVNNSNTSDVSQANSAENTNVSNSVADTGGNDASNNSSGENIISTGDATNNTSINNNSNVSGVNNGCCPEQVNKTDISISGNGAGSSSTVQSGSFVDQTVSAQNSSVVSNQITQKSVTGQNSNSFNNGSGYIKTGDIYAETEIENTGINNTSQNIQKNNDKGADINVSGNGALSNNKVKLDKRTEQIISSENNAVIKNYIKNEYETGNNKSIKNTRIFDIITGGIFANTSIDNNLNKNIFDISCCVKKASAQENAPNQEQKSEEKPSQQPAAAPSNNGAAASISSGNSGSSGSSGPGTSSGEVAGITARHLPITGNNWLFFSLLGNIIMLFFGAYLRLRSGNAPPAYAYA